MDCACINVDLDCGDPEFYSHKTPVAKKEHICSECREIISIGEKYDLMTGLWDGVVQSFKMCKDCKVIESVFFCNGTPLGSMWEDLFTYIDSTILDEDVGIYPLHMLPEKPKQRIIKYIEDKWAHMGEMTIYELNEVVDALEVISKHTGMGFSVLTDQLEHTFSFEELIILNEIHYNRIHNAST